MNTLQIVHSLARLQCTKCGAEANASCNCGQPYVPVALRVKEYDEANPGKSSRKAAADLGVSHGDRDEAKQEARESEECWSDIKDDWEAEWLRDNWDDKREQDFLDEFKNGWRDEHGQEFPASEFAQAKKGGAR